MECCNTNHLRDKNAATNILREGLKALTAVGATEVVKNACGHQVRLGVSQALVSEAPPHATFHSCEVQEVGFGNQTPTISTLFPQEHLQ